MTRTAAKCSINGAVRAVYDGTRLAGTIAERAGSWKATANGGHEVGFYPSALEASRAVLKHQNRHT